MLDVNSLEAPNLNQRWQHVNRLLDSWLAERQDLIVQFCRLSKIHKLTEQTVATYAHRLDDFCQILVDYVCAGHFEIYYQLLEEAEAFDDGSVKKAQRLLPSITETTQAILNFNDLYGNKEQRSDLSLLAKHLSSLGETLETRFNLEDRLVAKLHRSHEQQVA